MTNLEPGGGENGGVQVADPDGDGEGAADQSERALNNVYYIRLKSEDQQGAQYGFVGVALTNSFNQTDSNGNTVLTVISPPLPATIPGGDRRRIREA